VSERRRLVLLTIARYLGREFLRTFALTVLAFVAIYVIADFFDRFDDFLKHETPAGTIVRAFLFKIPFIIAQVTPLAVLTGALVGLGLLARNNEFVALRSCGVSLAQVLLPLTLLAAGISVATFAWGETVVPASARRWNEIWNQEVKGRKGPAGVFVGREVWFHGRAGFYNINRVAPMRRKLYGLTIYQMKHDEFRPARVIDIAEATWTEHNTWSFRDVHTFHNDAEGAHEENTLPAGFVLPESLDEFSVVAVDPEEFSYAMLRRQIHSLRAKGVDASESWVDLHLKIATPAASIVMMLLAIPLATRGTRATSLPAAAGIGFAVGFSYFFVTAFTRALGQAHTIPPLPAAWMANALFALIAGYLCLASD
jgi:lipopolysaccharide export system permease protein